MPLPLVGWLGKQKDWRRGKLREKLRERLRVDNDRSARGPRALTRFTSFTRHGAWGKGMKPGGNPNEVYVRREAEGRGRKPTN
jgi:hypothetical protein